MCIKRMKRFVSYFGLMLSLVLIMGCKATGLVNLQTGNSLADQNWRGEQTSFTVPFEWHDGHPIILLTINGIPDLRFALDSGAAATVMFETERTQAVKIEVEMQFDLQGAQVDVVNDTTIQIGQISLSDMTIIHVPIDQSPLFGSLDEAYFDGAIGYDVINHFVTQVNYADQTVTFFNPRSTITHSPDWVRLPMSLIGRIPHVSAKLQNQNEQRNAYTFTLDTGAPDYLYINSSLAAGLTFPDSVFESTTKNFEGEHTLYTSRLDNFEIAGSRFDNIAAHDLPYFKDDNGIGLIGSGLLRNFDLVFDYENSFVAFKKNRAFSTKTFIDRSGLQIEPHADGAIVKSVARNTDAERLGILPNDIATRIDGVPMKADNFDTLRSVLSSEKTEVDLCWLSKKQTKCGILKLANRIE